MVQVENLEIERGVQKSGYVFSTVRRRGKETHPSCSAK
jgi:hypothetical protein